MKIPFVDLHAQYLEIKEEIDSAIESVIRDSAFIRGPYVEAFEQEFAQAIGVEHCISCANGTDALYITMKGLGIQKDDEVITTAHSWISTSETITQAGGKVIFCDTDDQTFNIDPNQIATKITPRTVGIIPVHLYGQPADMDPIVELAAKHNLWVVEDCAQAHLAEYKGKKVGTFGNAATFSFYPGKNLGAMGDAGCIVTNDDDLAEWCKLYARHGGKGYHQIEGINSRMDGMQAAILSVKLPHLPKWVKTRQQIARQYNSLLCGIPGIKTPQLAQWRSHVYHLYVIRSENRDTLREHLWKQGIETAVNYPKALPFYPAYARLGHNPGDFPNAHRNQNKILSLPIYPELSETQLEFVAEKLRDFR
jgi:dTDP-4-amino-4,6-dideoxygalactose transaminase